MSNEVNVGYLGSESGIKEALDGALKEMEVREREEIRALQEKLGNVDGVQVRSTLLDEVEALKAEVKLCFNY